MRGLLIMGLALSLAACQDNLTPSDKNGKSKVSTECGQAGTAPSLLMTTVEPGNYPYQTRLLLVNPDTGDTKLLSDAESSDTMLLSSGSCDAVLFNRATGSHNFRSVFKAGDSFQLGPQTAFSSDSVSDPSKATLLRGDQILLANYVGSSLQVIDRNDGHTIAEKKADFGLTAGTAFRPADILVTHTNNVTNVFALHNAQVGTTLEATIGHTQAWLAFQWNGKEFSQSTSYAPKVSLTGSFPHVLSSLADGTEILLSHCATFMHEAKRGGPCRSVVESLNPVSGETRVLWDLDETGYFYNGAVIVDPKNPINFYAAVERVIDPAQPAATEKLFVYFDTAKKSTKVLYHYQADSYGTWFADLSLDGSKLYVGDGAGTTGSLHTLNPTTGEEFSLVSLPGAPSGAVWMH